MKFLKFKEHNTITEYNNLLKESNKLSQEIIIKSQLPKPDVSIGPTFDCGVVVIAVRNVYLLNLE